MTLILCEPVLCQPVLCLWNSTLHFTLLDCLFSSLLLLSHPRLYLYTVLTSITPPSTSSIPGANSDNFAHSSKTPRTAAFSVKEFQTEMLERTIVMLKEQLVSKENELTTEKFKSETLEARVKSVDKQVTSFISVQENISSQN